VRVYRVFGVSPLTSADVPLTAAVAPPATSYPAIGKSVGAAALQDSDTVLVVIPSRSG
jgi:hypothetical protein